MRPGSIPTVVHRCVMAYPDGEREDIPLHSWRVYIWTKANKTFHPAAALFVDGKCRYRGRFSDEEITKLEGELQ